MHKKIVVSCLILLFSAWSAFAQVRPTLDRTKHKTENTNSSSNTSSNNNSNNTSNKPSSNKANTNTTTQPKTTTSNPQPKFRISSEEAVFSAEGGTITFTVYGSTDWIISIPTASWGQLSREDNTLTLTVNANISFLERTDYFTIQSGDEKIRVNITQEAIKQENFVYISSQELHFSAAGGLKTITVQTSNDLSWYISRFPSEYIHLSVANGRIKVIVDPNKGVIRSDYFTVKCDSIVKIVDIYQDGASPYATLPPDNSKQVTTDEKSHKTTDAKPPKTRVAKSLGKYNYAKRYKPERCLIGGINCDFSPRFKWEGIGGWIGYMKRVGFYCNFLTNYNPNKSSEVMTEYDTPVENYHKIIMRRSYDGGLLIRTCKPLSLKIGCGYGKYREFVYCKYTSLYTEFHDWFYNPETSVQGIEFNLGLLFHINCFNLSIEATTIKFKHYDIRLGFGVSINGL